MLKKLLSLTVVCFLGAFFAAGAWGEPIKIGVPLSFTGPYAADGLGYFRGIKMAVDEINDQGGLLGRRVEMVKFDTQDLAPERVMQAADQLVGRENVASVHGGWAGWGQDVRAYGKYEVPFFMWDASLNSVSVIRQDPKKYSNVFQLVDTERPLSRDMFKVMAKLPVSYQNKKMAVVNADDSWGIESAKGMIEIAEERGWEVVLHETVPYGTREWGPILTKIKSHNPAIIYVEIISTPDLITFFRQFMKSPTHSVINFGYGLSLPDFIENIGTDGDGLLGETTGLPYPKAPTPQAQEWMNRFEKKFGANPAAGSFAVYTGVMMWAEAVRSVGEVRDYQAINDYLLNTPYESIAGRTLKFDEDHKISTKSWPLSHLQIQEGRLVTIYHGSDNPYKDYEFLTPPWMR